MGNFRSAGEQNVPSKPSGDSPVAILSPDAPLKKKVPSPDAPLQSLLSDWEQEKLQL